MSVEMATQMTRWMDTHFPDSLIEEQVWDETYDGLMTRFTTAQGDNVSIIAANEEGVGMCVDTEELANEIRDSFAIKQLARIFHGGVHITSMEAA
jgi:hypothetical protein